MLHVYAFIIWVQIQSDLKIITKKTWTKIGHHLKLLSSVDTWKLFYR